MAFGLPPKHTQASGLDGLTPSQYLAVSVTAIQTLGWKISHISAAGLIAYTEKKFMKPQQKFTLRLSEDQAILTSQSIGSEVLDMGRNEKNVLAFAGHFADKKNSMTPEAMADVYDDLSPNLVPADEDELAKPPATKKQNLSAIGSIFIPRGDYFITPIIIDLNLLIFIAMVATGGGFFQPDNETLIKWGADIRYFTLGGQWWRIVTNCFIHIGVFHVVLNMFAFLYIGTLLEPRLGRVRFLTAYLLTGITASLASLYWHTNVLSAGASGAIFGMYGVFLAMLTTNLIEKATRNALMGSTIVFIAYNLFYGTAQGIDNAAHIGGLLGGIIIGYLYYPGLKKPENPVLLYSPLVAAIILVAIATMFAFTKIPNTFAIYDQKMNAVVKLERRALSIYKLDSTASKEKWLHAIRVTGIRFINQSLDTLREIDKLDLSPAIREHNDSVIQYFNLRLQCFHNLYRKIEGTLPPGEDSVAYYNSQIQAMLDSFGGKGK